ncbi:hypothetical protein Lal_00000943 [Lupinus albus]|nr:hypothetical protein Lal_00000943 [Lupinus albus]
MNVEENILESILEDNNLDDFDEDVDMIDIEEGELVEEHDSVNVSSQTSVTVEGDDKKCDSKNRKRRAKKKKNKRKRNGSGPNVAINIDRFVLDTCRRLKEKKSYMVYTAVGCLGLSAISDIIKEDLQSNPLDFPSSKTAQGYTANDILVFKCAEFPSPVLHVFPIAVSNFIIGIPLEFFQFSILSYIKHLNRSWGVFFNPSLFFKSRWGLVFGLFLLMIFIPEASLLLPILCLSIDVDAIQACGGQKTADDKRFRTGGGVLWNIIKVREPQAYKEIMKKTKEFEKQFRHPNVKQQPMQKKEDDSPGVAFTFVGGNKGNVSDSPFPESQKQDQPELSVSGSKEKHVSVHDRLRTPVSYDDDLLELSADKNAN